MLKHEVETLLSCITDMKVVSDKLEFITSAKMNTLYNQMLAILQPEWDKLDNNKELDSKNPKIKIVEFDKTQYSQSMTNAENFSKQINRQIEELVDSGFRILDFELKSTELAYIKYTN